MNDEDFIKQWTPLVHKLAGKYSKQSYFLEFDELVSIGQFALLEARSKYDPNKNASLGTYFYNYASFKMLNELNSTSETKTRSQHNQMIAVKLAFKKLGDDVTLEEMVAYFKTHYKNRACHLNQARIQSVIALMNIRMDSITALEEAEGNLLDAVMPHSDPDYEESLDEKMRMESLITQTEKLNPKEQIVIKGRLNNKTYSEIGKELNLTTERIRQILNKAISKLRKRV